jgi:hypothetical protein
MAAWRLWNRSRVPFVLAAAGLRPLSAFVFIVAFIPSSSTVFARLPYMVGRCGRPSTISNISADVSWSRR